MHGIPLFLDSLEISSLLEKKKPIVILDVSQDEQIVLPNPNYTKITISNFMVNQGGISGYLQDFNAIHKPLLEKIANPKNHVIVIDDGNFIAASRVIWSMHAHGLYHCSLWIGCKQDLAILLMAHTLVKPESYALEKTLKKNKAVIADAVSIADVVSNERTISQNKTTLLDVRTPAEYYGHDNPHNSKGHIPKALLFPHTYFYDVKNNHTLICTADLIKRLQKMGVSKQSEIICYCHSHMRSAFAYCALKHAGYPFVSGYHGSYADWVSNSTRPIQGEA